jgi:tRNA modification GTPase
MDTAGIRESEETVEKEGIKRSRAVIERADLIFFVLDGSRPLDAEDERLWIETDNKDRIVVCNKADHPEFQPHEIGGRTPILVSALERSGLSELFQKLESMVTSRLKYSPGDSLISSQRHREILKQTLSALERAAASISADASEEFVLIDLQEGLRHMGEITGEVTVDDLYQHIFSNFCIGK